MKSTRPAAIISLLIMSVLALAIAGAAPASATKTPAKNAYAVTSFQNKALDTAMKNVPGGTRISADEVEWDGGRVIFGASPAAAASTVETAGAAYDEADPTFYEATDPTLNCASGYFCAWGSPDYSGTCWMFISDSDVASEFDWAAYSGSDCGSLGTWSWNNETPDRVWKEESFTANPDSINLGADFYYGETPSGTSWCIDPNVSNDDVTDNITRDLGWIYMSDNTSSC